MNRKTRAMLDKAYLPIRAIIGKEKVRKRGRAERRGKSVREYIHQDISIVLVTVKLKLVIFQEI